jgi:hypothetical protein
MPALDQCHDQTVRALEKAGWYLESEPYRLRIGYRLAYADLEMSRGVNGNRQQIMLVEVKCFPDPESTTRDLYGSIGQYLVYRAMIVELGLPHSLYLTVPGQVFNAIFDISVMRVIRESQIRAAIVDLETETITRWIGTESSI